MFSIGDTVVYGTDGVCTVTDITTRVFAKQKAEYYILTPVHQSGAVIYVPTASKALVAKMRSLLSADQLEQLLADVRNAPCETWIADENTRRQYFKDSLHSGDRRRLFDMIKTIYLHGKVQKENGRKLHHSDEMMMKDAEKLLYAEFGFVFGIKPDDVLPYIIEKLEG